MHRHPSSLSVRTVSVALLCAALFGIGLNVNLRSMSSTHGCTAQLADAQRVSEDLARENALVHDLLAQLRSVKADLSRHHTTSQQQRARDRATAERNVEFWKRKARQTEGACKVSCAAKIEIVKSKFKSIQPQQFQCNCEDKLAAAIAAGDCTARSGARDAAGTVSEAERDSNGSPKGLIGSTSHVVKRVAAASKTVGLTDSAINDIKLGDTSVNVWGDSTCESWVGQNRKGCKLHDVYAKKCAKKCNEPWPRAYKLKQPNSAIARNLPDWFVTNPQQDMRCGEAIPFVNLKLKLVMCTAPKAASTSWREMLVALHKQESEEYKQYKPLSFCPQKILRLSDLKDVDALQAMRIMADPNFFKMAFVRNPITRILSGYLMWLSNDTPWDTFIQNDIVGKPGCPRLNDNWSDLSQHWYPQHCRCGFQEGVKWDFIGKMEDLPSTFREIRRRHAIPEDMLDLKKWGLNNNLEPLRTVRKKYGHETGAGKKMCKFTLSQFDQVVAARKDEIEFFDYSDDVKRLRKIVAACPGNGGVTGIEQQAQAKPGKRSVSSVKTGKANVFLEADAKQASQPNSDGLAVLKVQVTSDMKAASWPKSAGPAQGDCALPATSSLYAYCPDKPVSPPPKDHQHVLEIGLSGHTGIGFWSQITYVLNQLLFARRRGFVPFVWLGKYSIDDRSKSKQLNEYFAESAGLNIWAYFFLPVSDFRPTTSTDLSCCYIASYYAQMCLAKGCIHGEESVLSYYYGHGKQAPTQVRDRAHMKADTLYDHKWYGEERKRATNALMQYVRFTPNVARKLEAWRQKLFAGGGRTLGVHIRGTDKVWGGGTIVAGEYKPFIRRYLHKYPNAKIFVATDSPSSLRALKRDPDFGNKVIHYDAGKMRTDGWASLSNVHGKSEAVFMDTMLLAMCDFLLLTSSAVAESAIYFNPKLHNNSLNLQFRCGHKSWLSGHTDGCIAESETPEASWGGRFEGCSTLQIAALKKRGNVERYRCAFDSPDTSWSGQGSLAEQLEQVKAATSLHAPDEFHVYGQV